MTVAGATSSTTMVVLAPAILLAVTSQTTAAITGATSYKYGISGEIGKFGSALGVAENSSNVGVIGPTGYCADRSVLLS